MHYRFTADHPGVFMYHCATQPVLMHTGAGMVGMFVVKPKNLAPVDKELWMTQQEYYIGKPGGDADMAKMQAKQPDVIALNGYGNQYKDNRSRSARARRSGCTSYAGPSIWSAFHAIGTVFDTAHTDNGIAHDVQTVNLAPSQGGWVEFTVDEEGTYPFVTHAFGDMVKGALGMLATPNAPKSGGGHDMGGDSGSEHAAHGTAAAAGSSTEQAGHGGTATAADVNVTLGDMYVKADTPNAKAGEVTFAVKNEGATMHGMAMALPPVDAPGGMLSEGKLLARGKELSGGESDVITAKLEPGSYELVCFLPGHYAAGQKIPFEVTS
jgi:uncharacterized cupredoxin-like copper-binding protein/FtsP/CotA-like multicopper oxidase with cupredoxin domain